MTSSVPPFSVQKLENIAPLKEPFGSDLSQTVPSALCDPLFGDAKAEHGFTYAILDGAKIPDLTEILATTELEYACLFQGDALEELGAVAPWIVKLEATDDFTRRLFTDDGATWHFWPHEAGIFLRSHRSLPDLRRHFRKFTMLEIEDRGWCYFRFWEPMWTHRLVKSMEQKDAAMFLTPLTRIVAVTATGEADIIDNLLNINGKRLDVRLAT